MPPGLYFQRRWIFSCDPSTIMFSYELICYAQLLTAMLLFNPRRYFLSTDMSFTLSNGSSSTAADVRQQTLPIFDDSSCHMRNNHVVHYTLLKL